MSGEEFEFSWMVFLLLFPLALGVFAGVATQDRMARAFLFLAAATAAVLTLLVGAADIAAWMVAQ